jgi:hypothetical protein
LFVLFAGLVGFGGCWVLAVFDTKKHSNVQRDAEYRRVGRNYKSPKKYKEEKQRRQRVLELHGKGLTIMQIALQVGKSERTIQRDLAKVKPYVKRLKKHFAPLESKQEMDKVNVSNLGEQFESVGKLIERWRNTPRKIHGCKNFDITLDVDAALQGRYCLKFKPLLPVGILPRTKITLNITINGETKPMGRLYAENSDTGIMHLSTNQSLNACVDTTFTQIREWAKKYTEAEPPAKP